MKFKVGDKVRIRSYKELKKEFGSTPNGSIKTKLTVLTIRSVEKDKDNDYISFRFEENPFTFSHDAIEPIPKYFTGEVVCIENYSDFTKGRIYKIKNGVFRDDVGYSFEEIKSVADLNERLFSQFIEVIR